MGINSASDNVDTSSMGFFQFNRKFDASKEFSLEEIPIFSSLSPAEQKLVEKRARLVEYKRGDVVYEENTEAEALYVVVAGRFRLFNRLSVDQEERNLIFFYRGDHFGEASLLTSNLHSGTVEAKCDGLILRFDKEDFFKLMSDVPALSAHLTRALGHRLQVSQGGKGPRREVKISAFYSTTTDDSEPPFLVDFAAVLKMESKREVVVVDFTAKSLSKTELFDEHKLFDLESHEPTKESDVRACLTEHPSGFFYMAIRCENLVEGSDKKISSLLTFLTYRYDHLLVKLPNDTVHPAMQCLKQSDNLYVYCDSSGNRSLTSCGELVADFEKRFGFSLKEIRILMLDEEIPGEPSFEEKEDMLGSRIFSLLPDPEYSPEGYDRALGYMARELSGTLIGVALGSGAAYGLSHIGVIRVLERENIPVDVIAGSSMGALVGALWAAGYTADELVEIASSIDKKSGFFKLLGFRDISIAHQGFFKGDQIYRFLKPYLKNRTFQQMKRPLRIVATDLFTAEEIVFRAGPVDDAIRASVSIPGIFRPFRYRNKLLIDGGVIDPLPVRVLSQLGVKKIIAVNVLPGPKDWAERYQLQKQKAAQAHEAVKKKGVFPRFWHGLGSRVKKHFSGNIFNAIMNTIQFTEYEMAESWGRKADVLIHPVTPEGHWAQFYEPEKFIKAGEDSASLAIEEIKQLLHD